MSQENVEIVRRHYEAFDRRQLDAAVEGWDPTGERTPAIAGAVEGQALASGLRGFVSYFQELLASFSEVQLQNREFRDLGDRVLVLYDLHVRGHDSGVAIDQPGGAIDSFGPERSSRARASSPGRKPSKPPSCRSNSGSGLSEALEQLVHGQREILGGRCRRRTWRSSATRSSPRLAIWSGPRRRTGIRRSSTWRTRAGPEHPGTRAVTLY